MLKLQYSSINFKFTFTLFLFSMSCYSNAKIIPNEILMTFKNELSLADSNQLNTLILKHKGTLSKTRCFCGKKNKPLPKCPCIVHVAQLPKEISLEESNSLLKSIQNFSFIKIAEQNAYRYLNTYNYHIPKNPADHPDATYYHLQWNLQQIKAPEAWELLNNPMHAFNKNQPVIVAIADTGVSNIAALRASLVEDGGFNFINETTNTFDIGSHGTPVASIIAAYTQSNLKNDQSPIAGLCWNRMKILPIVIGDNDTTKLYISRSIIYAVHQGAKVINLSLGGTISSDLELSAVNYAYSKNTVIVAAAGNSSSAEEQYPASYNKVLSVAGTNQQKEKPSFSNYGDWVSVAAPADDVPCLLNKNNMFYFNGTSFAAPHVAGLAALLFFIKPDANVKQIYNWITQNSDKESYKYCKHGIIDAYKSLKAAINSSNNILPLHNICPYYMSKCIPIDPYHFLYTDIRENTNYEIRKILPFITKGIKFTYRYLENSNKSIALVTLDTPMLKDVLMFEPTIPANSNSQELLSSALVAGPYPMLGETSSYIPYTQKDIQSFYGPGLFKKEEQNVTKLIGVLDSQSEVIWFTDKILDEIKTSIESEKSLRSLAQYWTLIDSCHILTSKNAFLTMEGQIRISGETHLIKKTTPVLDTDLIVVELSKPITNLTPIKRSRLGLRPNSIYHYNTGMEFAEFKLDTLDKNFKIDDYLWTIDHIDTIGQITAWQEGYELYSTAGTGIFELVNKTPELTSVFAAETIKGKDALSQRTAYAYYLNSKLNLAIDNIILQNALNASSAKLSGCSNHWTLIDSRHLLTSINRYTVGEAISVFGTNNNIQEILNIQKTGIEILRLSKPITHIAPVERLRKEVDGEIINYKDTLNSFNNSTTENYNGSATLQGNSLIGIFLNDGVEILEKEDNTIIDNFIISGALKSD